MSENQSQNIRNICIIAHVDHGKTTLVDFLLRQAGTFRTNEQLQERVMDSMDLERERGITILAKNTSVRVGNTKINIVDTPGHSDFGGEVERIMCMVDGALLLVDAAEGPLPQTRFVLRKAFAQGLKIIVVINKVDRPDARVKEVLNLIYDLFIDLGAHDDQIDFPVIYACARAGWCTKDFDEIERLLKDSSHSSLKPLFNTVLEFVPPPQLLEEKDFKMLVSNLSYSDYVGRLSIGRVLSGSLKQGEVLFRKGRMTDTNITQKFPVTKIFTYEGLRQVEVGELCAGDIGVVSGCEDVEIGDTLTSSETTEALPRIVVEVPTLAMLFSVNTSPLSGKEGEAIQSRGLRERLLKEVRQNVALRFEETEVPDRFRILGRGELQFAILIEQMRREGFEFMVGKPIVLYQTNEMGEKLEPMEKAVLDLPQSSVGDVSTMFQQRKGILTKYEGQSNSGSGRVRLEFDIPSRGLLGMRSRYLTATKGEGLFSTQFLEYGPYKGEIPHRTNGSLVCDRAGVTVEYGLHGLEDRGSFFVGIGVSVYEGMIVGEHAKENDLNVNPCREKKLTNMRSVMSERVDNLIKVTDMSLERCLEWIDEDEWIEVTPLSIRLRKKVLSQNQRSVRRVERVS